MSKRPDSFNVFLELPTEELRWELPGAERLEPCQLEFLLNPRRLRGSDFLMRWAQGRWSEDVVTRAINATKELGVLPYGPSTVAPEDPKELERFFEKLDAISAEGKRPDLLLYDKATYEWARREVERRIGGTKAIAETAATALQDIVSRARFALEVENSLWVTEKMPGFGRPFLRFVRGKRKGKLKAPGVVPTLIVKMEDIPRLEQWEARHQIPIYVVHVFYDRGYFIRFKEILELLKSGELYVESESYSQPGGSRNSSKPVVKVPYILAKEFGTVSGPSLAPKTFIDKNGKVMTYVSFSGGEVKLSSAVLEEWTA